MDNQAEASSYRCSSSPSYQQIIAADALPADDVLKEVSHIDIPVASVPRSEYTSPDFARAEEERMWPRVWQFACREEQIPEPGDLTLYESPTASFIIVRTESGGVRAFYNSCLHRGMKLCTHDTSVAKLACPFHGFTWSLDGELIHVPSRWDFPELEAAAMRLPEVRVESWQGFVFINQDGKAQPLEIYLGHLVSHFASWNFDDLRLKSIIRKSVKSNWKVGMDAVIEVYHIPALHPQVVAIAGVESTQYDVWADDPHVSRMLHPVGLPSDQHPHPVSEQEILDIILGVNLEIDNSPTVLPEGMTARQYVADGIRQMASTTYDRDYSQLSNTEAGDGLQYSLFPNLVMFRSISTPAFHRFLPMRDDPSRHWWEVWVLGPAAKGEEDGEIQVIELGERPFTDSGEAMPSLLAAVLDQDVEGEERCQEGLQGGNGEDLIFARYQEVRVRHFHQTLHRYLDGDL